MGTFTVRIEVGDVAGRRFESVEALVDTAATNTVLPEAMLTQLGVKPYRRSRFQLADGSQLELDVGRTWVRVDGQEEFTQVVFGGVEFRAHTRRRDTWKRWAWRPPARAVNKYLM